MKNLFKILILSLLLISISVSNEITPVMSVDKLILRGMVYYHPENYAPYTGLVVGIKIKSKSLFSVTSYQWYKGIDEDNTISYVSYEGYIENGFKNGLFTFWSFSGVILQTMNYKNGQLHGRYVEYFNSGLVKLDCNYLLGELDGQYTTYFSRKYIIRDNNKRPTGEKGYIKEKGLYSLGNKVGKWIEYNSNGFIKKEYEYDD